MEELKISKAEARRFLVHYHGLDSFDTFSGEQGILDFFKRVGCIQYDPLNVVGRNADLVLQSRISDYSPQMLDKLLYTDRTLIDGWDKMMAIYRSADWPYFYRVRKYMEKAVISTLRNRGSLEALEFTAQIREILTQQGPLLSSKINLGKVNKGGWGHSNLSSAAMDFMFNSGELGIHSKRNTQKIYDLTENLLPKELLASPDPFNNDEEFYKWYIKRRIGSVGLLWGRSGGGWLGPFLSDKKLRTTILAELLKEESIISISIEGLNEAFYIRAEDAALLKSVPEETEPRLRFLAPLDNLLWDRGLIEKLFDFQYTWEVYVPAANRKYGYYVLPVLYGDQLVARFEPEQQRGSEPLTIKNWWWEEGITVSKDMKSAVKKSLKQFCRYLQAEGVQKESLSKIK